MMKRLLSYLFCGLILASCTEKDHADDTSRNIQMRAYIGEASGETRSVVVADPWKGTMPSNLKTLPVRLLFSLESGVYSSVPTSLNFLPCHTTLTYSSNSPKDPDVVKYTPEGGSEQTGQPKYPSTRDSEGNPTLVYCTGLYPQKGWAVARDGKTASINIDGSVDVMYASEISGSIDSHFGPQNYLHQLTWIKLYVCATTHEAAELWENIEEVSIASKDQVTVDLKTGELTPTGNIIDYTTHTGSIPLETIVASVGSIFCAPASSYTVKIKTSNSNETQNVTINAPDGAESFKSGNLYVLEVYFTTTEVKGACTLAQWEYQDEDLNVS